MNELREKIILFLKETGIPAFVLANHSNVSRALLSCLINGKQKDITYTNALSLEKAMNELCKTNSE